jgi:hypothetical protein
MSYEPQSFRHSGAGRNPFVVSDAQWIPACAGMTSKSEVAAALAYSE